MLSAATVMHSLHAPLAVWDCIYTCPDARMRARLQSQLNDLLGAIVEAVHDTAKQLALRQEVARCRAALPDYYTRLVAFRKSELRRQEYLKVGPPCVCTAARGLELCGWMFGAVT
jgi:hypothetical protein